MSISDVSALQPSVYTLMERRTLQATQKLSVEVQEGSAQASGDVRARSRAPLFDTSRAFQVTISQAGMEKNGAMQTSN